MRPRSPKFLTPWRATALYALCSLGVLLAIEFSSHTTAGDLPDDWGRHLLDSFVFIVVASGCVHLIARRLFREFGLRDQAMREQEQRWSMALTAAGDGMWDVDVISDRAEFTPEWLGRLGYTPADLRGSWGAWLALVHPEDRAELDASVERHLANPAVGYRCEFRVRTRAGDYRWVLSRGRVVEFTPDGKPRRVIGTHTDITASKLAEQEIAEAAGRYRELFDANPDPMWIYDPGTYRFLAVNEAAVRKYGYTREQFLAMTILDIRSPEEAQRVRERIRSLEGGKPQHAALWQHRRADGSMITVEITSQPMQWRNCEARVVVARDVTEQITSRRALEVSERKFSAIFHGANDAMFVINARARIVDCNQRALEMFQTSREEMIGNWVPRYFPGEQPDGSDSVRNSFGLLRQIHDRPLGPLEWTNRRKDGSAFPCEVTVSPLSEERVGGFIVVVRDISERKRTTERLQLLHAALQATADGWMITNARGLIEWVNPGFTRMTGYSPEESLGRNPSELLNSGRQTERFYAQMWDAISRGEVWRGEMQNRRKDGSIYEERMTVAPVRDANGRISHFVSTKQEITAERQLEQQLARAQRLESIGMLASGIAHDLNNVLTPILLCVEFLKLEFPGDGTAAKLKLVEQAAQRGASIVRQVLTFSRGVEGEHSVLQPNIVLKEVGQLARETLPRNIAVQIEGVREDGPTIEGDVTQLHQALLNLVVNARDAMPNGGQLRLRRRDVEVDEVRARRNSIAPGLYVELSVADTGSGIPPDAMERIFDPFFTTKPRGKGTGLGLSTVYGIVRGHRGAVEVQSDWGVGSIFTLLLPAHHSAPLSPAPAAAPVKLEGRGRLVLVVDDEPPIRSLICRILQRHGFQTMEAEDGIDALALFRLRPATEWVLAITDMMMPRLDGPALAGELKKLAPGLPVVGISGLIAETHLTTRAPFPGAIEHRLPKPFSEEELLRIVERYVAAVQPVA